MQALGRAMDEELSLQGCFVHTSELLTMSKGRFGQLCGLALPIKAKLDVGPRCLLSHLDLA